MTNERKVALRVLAHFLDNMDYWDESCHHYLDNQDTSVEKVNAELFKIQKQIISRYKLNEI